MKEIFTNLIFGLLLSAENINCISTNYALSKKIEKDINRYIISLVTGEKIPLSQCKIKELKELLISAESEIP